MQVQAQPMQHSYCDNIGNSFSYQDLLFFRHQQLACWAKKLGDDTLVLFERHSLAPDDIAERLNVSNCFWFDTISRLSGMPQITAESLLVIAASVGLFSDQVVKTYPKYEDFCTLNALQLKKRSYIIRHPTKKDLSRLVELENLCWQHSQTSQAQILKRIEKNPRGQFVLEKSGQILGVGYSQTIENVSALYQSKANNAH
jgi:hypothetical protein